MSDIKSNRLDSIYLFMGDEDFLIGQGVAALKRALLPGEESNWNLGQFEGKVTDCEEVVSFLSILPVFGAKRVAVVRDFDHWNAAETESLLPLLEDMPEYAHLIMVASKIDKRTKCYRLIKSRGKVVEVPGLDATAAGTWVIKRGAALGLEISRQAARRLVDQVGCSLWQLDSELSKLACYKDNGDPEVTEQEIEQIAVTGREVADNAIFRFTDAVAEGNRRLAMDLLERLLASGREPLSILAMIARQLRIIAFASEASRAGIPQSDIARELGVPGFAIQRALNQGQHIGPDGMRGALLIAFQTDREIKSGLHLPDRALELLVVRLTEAMSNSGWS